MDSGAINKHTLEYVLPIKGTKSHKYKCPDCNKDLILCKGKIRKPYFRHNVDKNHPCTYYTNPSETQIHKDAKLRLKEIIKTKNVTVNRYCCNCKNTKQYNVPEICEKSEICIEHKFVYNESNKSADVALLKDGKIIQIYEICKTHKTKEKNRPDPWYEFDAESIVEVSNKEDNHLEITCIRDIHCDKCINMDNLKRNDLEKWIRIKLGQQYYYENKIINKEEYNNLSDEEKELVVRTHHQRIDFSGQRCDGRCKNCCGGNGIKSCNDDLYNNNKKICELFLDDLNTNRIVIYSWKGQITGYIISKKDFERYDYWNNKYWCDGSNSHLDLPYIYTNIYYGDGTVDILKDLIVNSLKINPINECKYMNSLPKSELSVDNDCYACNNTGISYWSDEVYGPCMECDRGDVEITEDNVHT